VASIIYSDPTSDTQFEIDFPTLITIIKGSSINSAALSEDFFELGLADKFNLRVQGRPTIFLTPTLNKGELPPIRVQVSNEKGNVSALSVERHIRSFRQLYAIAVLVDSHRENEAFRTVRNDPNADLEQLLKPRDRLLLKGMSEGSVWLTLATKSRQGFKSLTAIGALFYDEGRQALLERMQATTQLKKLGVEEKKMHIAYERANKAINLIQKVEKIKDPAVRDQIKNMLSSNIDGLNAPALPAPKPAEKKKKGK
jgi:hypothetical protein